MPRMQVYLPDELYNLVKKRRLPASELLQKAVRAELRRRDLLAASDRYVADLVSQVGAEPDGTVLTSDPHDLAALAAHAQRVTIERI